jgi:hypothetical protein
MGTLGRVIFTVGKWIRGTGQVMDRVGSTIQGGLRAEEQGKPSVSLPPFLILATGLLPRCYTVISISRSPSLGSWVNGGQFVALAVACF